MYILNSTSYIRHVIEALINQVVELNREIEEKLAGILVDGSEPAEMNDGNDGNIYASTYSLSVN